MSEKKDIHILYAEDDLNLGFVVKDLLEDNGYRVKICTNGSEAIKQFSQGNFQICVLDVMMPQIDGFEVAEFVRKTHPETPIIFLTAKNLSEDKIRGLKLGADDYITKPFSSEELLLRIQNVLRRTADLVDDTVQDTFSIGSYTLNFQEYTLEHADGNRQLTEKEALLLKTLALRINQTVQRDILLKSVWGKDDYFTGRSMDVFISRLRKYLGDDENIKIQSVHGVGLKLVVDAA